MDFICLQQKVERPLPHRFVGGLMRQPINPTYADGDLNGDGIIDDADLDLAFAQFGLAFDWVVSPFIP